ncbi:acyl-CoA dehydrogenase family protein [Marinobacter adhaerens]|jgi:acyl-CoA dehydrogenase|uniref:Acyl-CoA/acyl-ACP dehydrogenase n=2 Tax=Marinobacter adhaerens TaxID=1033846 RepID=A0ABX8IMH1_9GAMM|nr:acyl-CoA dehydrogenase family protein [Marinobacter adhaerens]ADP95818.1 acyl-CoA dehydrogenase domain protein [Marinobacter adhaerens HP15]QWV13869.1 acyl-CoA/acyl-ACP dehydrogenase [Marinobacter adhaerens]
MRELFESTIERLLGDLSTTECIRSAESGGWAGGVWEALEENGFTLASVSEDNGGVGAGWGDLFVVARAAGRHMAPVPLVEMLLANWLLELAGLEAKGGVLTVAPEGMLERTGNLISGDLRQVPWGRHSHAVVALLSEGERSSVVLLQTADASAVTKSNNVAGEPRDTLTFTSVSPLAVGELPDGVGNSSLQLGGAMLRSAQMAGAMSKAMELSSNYAAERKQFGRPIAKFQAIQQQLAIMAEQTAAASVASESAFSASDSQLNAFRIAAAKIATSDGASEAARIAHSVHGAIGFTQEYELQLLTRRLWSWRGEFGSSTFWSKVLGEHICASGSRNFWAAITHSHLQELKLSR